MKALNHNFETKDGISNLAEILGYTECLNNILDWINEAEKDGYFLNLSDLKEVIYSTNVELINLTPEKPEPDSLFEQMAQIVKTDAKIRYNIDL